MIQHSETTHIEDDSTVENDPGVTLGEDEVFTYSPVRMFAIALVTIFTAEVAIMAALHTFFPQLHPVVEAVVDGTLLVLLVFPVLFFTIFRPMNMTITRLEKHQEALRSFKEAIEHTGHSVVITDRNGQIEYVNPTVEEMTGYSKDEVLGKNPRLWKSGEHPPQFYESMWDVILSGRTFKAEVINTDKHGNNFTIHQTISPIFDDEGDIKRFVAVYNDVTALKARERQLREEKRRIDRLQQRLTVLNRVLRHDIRTAVSVILGNVELLDHEDVDREPLESIERRAQQVNNMAEEARRIEQSLSRTDTVAETDITTVLEDVVATIRAKYPDARLDVDVPDAMITSVSTKISIAFEQVLTNAIVHNDSATPEIVVSGVNQDDHLLIEIADNGPGIPEAELEPLREGQETQLQHSSGLGLWLTLWIVQDSDGTIVFDTNEPRGTVVRITLPHNSDDGSQ